MKNTLHALLSNKPVVIGTSIVLGLLSAFIIVKVSSNKENLVAQSVTLRPLVEKVTATGKVKASEEVSLAFGRSGTVRRVYADAGTSVKQGQVIAALDASDLSGQLTQAQALLSQNQIKLNNLVSASSGTAGNSGISTTISNSEQSFRDKLQSSYTAVDSAVKQYVNQFFNNPTTNPTFGATITQGNGAYTIRPVDSNLEGKINDEEHDLLDLLSQWNNENSTHASIDTINATAKQALTTGSSLLEDIAFVLNTYTPTDAGSKAVYDSYRANISSARASVDTASSNISSAQESYNSAKSGASPYEISLAQTNVDSTQGQVQSIQAEIAKTMIIAPFDGVVSHQDAKTGETAAQGTSVVGLISDKQFEIEAQISEKDIGKIQVGQAVDISLDTYGPNTLFTGTVSAIDPGETVTDTIGTYKTTIIFSQDDPRIRSGMTANASITTAKKDSGLSVPTSAIIKKGPDSYVLLQNADKTYSQVKVAVGIESSDGFTEIVSGLKEGDSVAGFGNN